MSARLAPELVCRDLRASLEFYLGVLGFRVAYDRPDAGFACLEREGAELMLEQQTAGSWLTGAMTPPFGRGINFQIEVSDIAALREAVRAAGHGVYREIEDAWYRTDNGYAGNRQFLVQDPDGYLLRFFQNLGRHPTAPAGPNTRVVG